METLLTVIIEGRVLLAPGGYRPGMLPNILQCTGQAPRTKSYPGQNDTVPRLRNANLIKADKNFKELKSIIQSIQNMDL